MLYIYKIENSNELLLVDASYSWTMPYPTIRFHVENGNYDLCFCKETDTLTISKTDTRKLILPTSVPPSLAKDYAKKKVSYQYIFAWYVDYKELDSSLMSAAAQMYKDKTPNPYKNIIQAFENFNFHQHCERASKEVGLWPSWKKDACYKILAPKNDND